MADINSDRIKNVAQKLDDWQLHWTDANNNLSPELMTMLAEIQAMTPQEQLDLAKHLNQHKNTNISISDDHLAQIVLGKDWDEATKSYGQTLSIKFAENGTIQSEESLLNPGNLNHHASVEYDPATGAVSYVDMVAHGADVVSDTPNLASNDQGHPSYGEAYQYWTDQLRKQQEVLANSGGYSLDSSTSGQAEGQSIQVPKWSITRKAVLGDNGEIVWLEPPKKDSQY